MVLKETWKATDVQSCSEFLGLKVVSAPALQSKQLPGAPPVQGLGRTPSALVVVRLWGKGNIGERLLASRGAS